MNAGTAQAIIQLIVKDMGSKEVGELTSKFGGLTKGMQESDDAAQKYGGSFTELNSKLELAAKGLTLVVDAAKAAYDVLAAGPKMLFDWSKGAYEVIDSTNEMAATMGLTADQLQAMTKAASLNGVSNTQLQRTISSLTLKIQEAAGGSKGAVDDFTKLGVTLNDLKSKSPAQVFDEVARKIGSITDPAQRAEAAVDLLGRQGARLVPLFANWDQSIGSANSKLDAMGTRITPQAIAAASRFEAVLADTSSLMSALPFKIGANLMEPFSGLFDKINVALGEVVRNVHVKEFTDAIADIFNRVAYGVPWNAMAQSATEAINKIISTFDTKLRPAITRVIDEDIPKLREKWAWLRDNISDWPDKADKAFDDFVTKTLFKISHFGDDLKKKLESISLSGLSEKIGDSLSEGAAKAKEKIANSLSGTGEWLSDEIKSFWTSEDEHAKRLEASVSEVDQQLQSVQDGFQDFDDQVKAGNVSMAGVRDQTSKVVEVTGFMADATRGWNRENLAVADAVRDIASKLEAPPKLINNATIEAMGLKNAVLGVSSAWDSTITATARAGAAAASASRAATPTAPTASTTTSDPYGSYASGGSNSDYITGGSTKGAVSGGSSPYMQTSNGYTIFNNMGLSGSSSGLKFFADGGIVTQPTLGVLGENGPEAVIPLKFQPGSGSYEYYDSMKNDPFADQATYTKWKSDLEAFNRSHVTPKAATPTAAGTAATFDPAKGGRVEDPRNPGFTIYVPPTPPASSVGTSGSTSQATTSTATSSVTSAADLMDQYGTTDQSLIQAILSGRKNQQTKATASASARDLVDSTEWGGPNFPLPSAWQAALRLDSQSAIAEIRSSYPDAAKILFPDASAIGAAQGAINASLNRPGVISEFEAFSTFAASSSGAALRNKGFDYSMLNSAGGLGGAAPPKAQPPAGAASGYTPGATWDASTGRWIPLGGSITTPQPLSWDGTPTRGMDGVPSSGGGITSAGPGQPYEWHPSPQATAVTPPQPTYAAPQSGPRVGDPIISGGQVVGRVQVGMNGQIIGTMNLDVSQFGKAVFKGTQAGDITIHPNGINKAGG